MIPLDRALVGDALLRGFIAADGAKRRREDETKVDELVAFLADVERVIAKSAKRAEFVLVDAAAGKGYVGVLAAALLLRDRPARIVLVERDENRLADALSAAARLEVTHEIVTIATDVDDASAYPDDANLVVGLHACGDASDRILERAIASRARNLLLIPCCVGRSTRGESLARSIHASLALPDAAPIARRMVHAIVDGERILRLESAGYQTDALEFVPPRVTPYNVLLRARRVDEPVRKARSRDALDRLTSFAGVSDSDHLTGLRKDSP